MTTSSQATQQTLKHHLQSFATGDVDAIMSDYTDDSVLITPESTLRGLSQIRPLFEMLFSGVFPPGSTEFEMKTQTVEGEVAYILWSASSNFVNVPLGTDTFVIRGGKIVAQTFVAQIEPKG